MRLTLPERELLEKVQSQQMDHNSLGVSNPTTTVIHRSEMPSHFMKSLQVLYLFKMFYLLI